MRYSSRFIPFLAVLLFKAAELYCQPLSLMMSSSEKCSSSGVCAENILSLAILSKKEKLPAFPASLLKMLYEHYEQRLMLRITTNSFTTGDSALSCVDCDRKNLLLLFDMLVLRHMHEEQNKKPHSEFEMCGIGGGGGMNLLPPDDEDFNEGIKGIHC